mgnify:CR=1 FL=1
MTEYENSKWLCEKNLLEAAHNIRNMEEQIDKVYKVSMYIIRKYGDELQKDFKAKIMSKEDFMKQKILGDTLSDDFCKNMYDYYVNQAIFDKIAEEMKKQYPEPWYSYGFCNTSKEA